MKTFCLGESRVAVHDIFDPLPEFMHAADVLFVDIPYNQSLLTNYSNRPGVTLSEHNSPRFGSFLGRLLTVIDEIAPQTVFVECGKEALPELLLSLRATFHHVTFYNSTYYRKAANKAYIIHASQKGASIPRRLPELEDMDEADAVAWICRTQAFACIGDLCMGKGLVGREAHAAGKHFVGTELNPARLRVLVDRLGMEECLPG